MLSTLFQRILSFTSRIRVGSTVPLKKKITIYFLFKLSLFFVCLFWPHCTARGILVPRPGVEPGSPVVEAWSPNHWTTREFPQITILNGAK